MIDEARYWLEEWENYAARPERFQGILQAIRGRRLQRVLDVGCGAGQELLPFVTVLGAKGVGVDLSPEALQIATRKYAEAGLAAEVEFRRCAAERLPFDADQFDLITCRLVLPYTHNLAALTEMGRVLKPGGLLVLKIHHARYYLSRLWRSLSRGDLRTAFYAVRVLASGLIYHLAGSQPKGRSGAREVFQTRWLLHRTLAASGLALLREWLGSDANPRTPIFLITKRATPAIAPPRRTAKPPTNSGFHCGLPEDLWARRLERPVVLGCFPASPEENTRRAEI